MHIQHVLSAEAGTLFPYLKKQHVLSAVLAYINWGGRHILILFFPPWTTLLAYIWAMPPALLYINNGNLTIIHMQMHALLDHWIM
jgi:hypothetical protein